MLVYLLLLLVANNASQLDVSHEVTPLKKFPLATGVHVRTL